MNIIQRLAKIKDRNGKDLKEPGRDQEEMKNMESVQTKTNILKAWITMMVVTHPKARHSGVWKSRGLFLGSTCHVNKGTLEMTVNFSRAI